MVTESDPHSPVTASSTSTGSTAATSSTVNSTAMKSGNDDGASGTDAVGDNKRKRASTRRPRAKRKRKRARGGVGVFSDGAGEDENSMEGTEVETDIVPLFGCFESMKKTAEGAAVGTAVGAAVDVGGWDRTKRIRIVKPYPFTFATFAKARWLGRPILEVYHEEFGSYPKSYYESAIKSGRILVSGKKVQPSYLIRGQDQLSHTVHRHEPAVALSDATCTPATTNNTTTNTDPNSKPTPPLINIVHEDKEVLVIDKPSTIPIHPCGGYNFNSLPHILTQQDPSLQGRLFTVHRLDRLTSGITIVAKRADVAKTLGVCIMEREGCHKVYLARVKGRFPLCARSEERVLQEERDGGDGSAAFGAAICKDLGDASPAPPTSQAASVSKAATNRSSFWITDEEGDVRKDASLSDVFGSRIDLATLRDDGSGTAAGTTATADSNEDNEEKVRRVLWLHLSCPCEIICHKNGICQAGSGGKPARTAFTVISYDETTDSTLLLCKPFTGRTHQIRLHLQYLGHPIANDPNYGGDMFFADPAGLRACKIAQEKIDEADSTPGKQDDGHTPLQHRPQNAISTDIPASEEEIIRAGMHHDRKDGETTLSFIERSCVWCHRSRGENRSVLEFLVRSRGIWLHAFQYSMIGPEGKVMTYRTELPAWTTLPMAM